MKPTHSLCLALAGVILAVPCAVAQEHPDFSGSWTRLDPRPSPDSSHIERITQQRDFLTVDVESHTSFGSMAGAFKGARTYTIGGPLESKKSPDGSVRSVGVSWDGANLVFLRTTTEGANTTTEREVWTLGDGGAMLFKDRRTTDWHGTRDERVVFQRGEGKPGRFMVYGVAEKSCRTWVSERHALEGAANLQWVLGYVTAYGVDHAFQVGAGGAKAGDLRPTTQEEIGQIINKYCGDRHPDSDLWRAADDLIRQLGGTRPTASAPVREYR